VAAVHNRLVAAAGAVADTRLEEEVADSHLEADSHQGAGVVDSHREAVAEAENRQEAEVADSSPAVAGAVDWSWTLPRTDYCTGGSGCGLSAACSAGTQIVDIILSASVCRLASHKGNSHPT
jgi:hypothetical protein